MSTKNIDCSTRKLNVDFTNFDINEFKKDIIKFGGDAEKNYCLKWKKLS